MSVVHSGKPQLFIKKPSSSVLSPADCVSFRACPGGVGQGLAG